MDVICYLLYLRHYSSYSIIKVGAAPPSQVECAWGCLDYTHNLCHSVE